MGKEWKPIDPESIPSFRVVSALLPAMHEIPKEFHNFMGTKWNNIISTWFFSGLPGDTQFIAKDGVDAKMALMHIAAIMRSWEPKHEHKDAGCSYLMSLWFDDVIIPKKAGK